jgi:creatinine amidohydrolase/Fe(II)-dependent formamide hydrolase-like protein
VPPWVHFKNVCYQVRAADALGFHAAILITGHYGPNWQDLKRLVELIQPRVGARLYALPDFEANQPGFAGDGKSGGDHAGRVETSLLWALEPDCVDVSRIPPEPGQHFAMGPNAAEANRRTGERMVGDEVRWLAAKARELLDAYEHERPTARLRTFADVEALWRELVEPELPAFQTMQPRWGSQPDPVPEDSGWASNAAVPSEPP